MKPCDVYDSVTAGKLKEDGLGLNEWYIIVKPLSVLISNNTTELRIPQKRFKAFAEWYLREQSEDTCE
jgi:hypothetical protein